MKKKAASAAKTKKQTIEEAEETLRAIREGAVDAFVMTDPDGHRVYTLEDSDLPYSVMVERMQQGAAMLNGNCEIIYCNPSLAQLLGMTRESVLGLPMWNFLAQSSQSYCEALLREAQKGFSEGEIPLRQADGAVLPAHFAFRLLSKDKSAIGVLVTDLTAQKQRAEFASRLQRLQDDERRRIARELHDSVGQLLVAIGMNIARIQTEAHKMSPEAAKLVQDNAGMIGQINNEIRTISHLLHPPLLDEVGLSAALRWYVDGFAERSKIKATLDIPDDLGRMPQEVEIAIFRAVQECLTNVHRHSGSSTCSVIILRDENRVGLEIRDSGHGISEAQQSKLATSGGVGLRGMRERFSQLGGNLTIESSEGGTIVKAAFPLASAGLASSSDEDVA